MLPARLEANRWRRKDSWLVGGERFGRRHGRCNPTIVNRTLSRSSHGFLLALIAVACSGASALQLKMPAPAVQLLATAPIPNEYFPGVFNIVLKLAEHTDFILDTNAYLDSRIEGKTSFTSTRSPVPKSYAKASAWTPTLRPCATQYFNLADDSDEDDPSGNFDVPSDSCKMPVIPKFPVLDAATDTHYIADYSDDPWDNLDSSHEPTTFEKLPDIPGFPVLSVSDDTLNGFDNLPDFPTTLPCGEGPTGSSDNSDIAGPGKHRYKNFRRRAAIRAHKLALPHGEGQPHPGDRVPPVYKDAAGRQFLQYSKDLSLLALEGIICEEVQALPCCEGRQQPREDPLTKTGELFGKHYEILSSLKKDILFIGKIVDKVAVPYYEKFKRKYLAILAGVHHIESPSWDNFATLNDKIQKWQSELMNLLRDIDNLPKRVFPPFPSLPAPMDPATSSSRASSSWRTSEDL